MNTNNINLKLISLGTIGLPITSLILLSIALHLGSLETNEHIYIRESGDAMYVVQNREIDEIATRISKDIMGSEYILPSMSGDYEILYHRWQPVIFINSNKHKSLTTINTLERFQIPENPAAVHSIFFEYMRPQFVQIEGEDYLVMRHYSEDGLGTFSLLSVEGETIREFTLPQFERSASQVVFSPDMSYAYGIGDAPNSNVTSEIIVHTVSGELAVFQLPSERGHVCTNWFFSY